MTFRLALPAQESPPGQELSDLYNVIMVCFVAAEDR